VGHQSIYFQMYLEILAARGQRMASTFARGRAEGGGHVTYRYEQSLVISIERSSCEICFCFRMEYADASSDENKAALIPQSINNSTTWGQVY